MDVRPLPSGTVTVLSSGGMDSTALIAFFSRQRAPVAGLFVDYGQPAVDAERRAALAVANHYNIHMHQFLWSGGYSKDAGFVRGRNAFLLSAALLETTGTSGIIAIGLHAGTPYYDCSPAFLDAMQTIFDGYADGAVRLSAPFLTWTKRQIWDYCLQEHVPIEFTHSCEEGSEQCGRCLSCRDFEALRALK